MANAEVAKVVDDLIRQGRVTENLRSEYETLIEKGLGDHLLRGADYTKKTQALAADRKQAEQWLLSEREKLQSERQRLSEWEAQAKKDLDEYNRVMREVPEMTAEIAAYRQTLKDYQILDQVNLPPRQTPGGPAPAPAPAPINPNPAPVGSFITRADADKFASDLLLMTNKMQRIQAQHQRLFGEPLEDDLISHFLQTGEDPENHWRVKYAVDNKKAEIEARNRAADIEKIKAEAKAEVMREMALDPSRVTGAPGQRVGGVSPHLEQFMSSRALDHSQNNPNDKAATGQGDFIPPEKRSIMSSQRDRVDAATKMFLENWDPITGRPTTEKGQRLHQEHFVPDA